MSSLTQKDRVSLCLFTFADGRRCRTPRISSHPHFCFDHAQKEARARATETLGKDLAYFFSGDYLSACDLSAALARLIPAVLRGDVKPRTARTVAYMVQTLLQAIHISEQEYINAFGTGDWRKAIRNSINGNHDYLFPPAPKPEKSESPQPQPQPRSQPQPVQPQTQEPAKPQTEAPQPGQSPHTPLPPTSDEFVQHVVAGLQTVASAPTLSPTSAPSPQTPTAQTAPSSPACHPGRSAPFGLRENLRSEGSHPAPTTQFTPSSAPSPQPLRTGPSSPERAVNRDPYAVHYDHTLLLDGKPF